MAFYSKKIIGYAYGKSMTSKLAVNVVKNACLKEEIHHHKYYDFKIASRAIFEYIESWCNRKRIHSSINYMTSQAVHENAQAVS